MKIVISGDRTEGKTTLLCALAHFLVENDWAVALEHPLPLEELTKPVDLLNEMNPRSVTIHEENSSENVWDGFIQVDALAVIRKV